MPITNANHERVTRIIAEQLGYDESQITPEKSIVADLGADSLDTVELVMALEDEFRIEITDEDGEAVKTVQNAFDLIDRMTPAIA